jgi:large subunit ribosomal protein L1
MPNPKVGTVTMDVAKAVGELKAGRVEFRVEKAGIVHSVIGKKSFGAEKLAANLSSFVDILVKMKPSTAKGTYVKSITISSTYGPGIKVDPASIDAK